MVGLKKKVTCIKPPYTMVTFEDLAEKAGEKKTTATTTTTKKKEATSLH